jgi:hypothetical protein
LKDELCPGAKTDTVQVQSTTDGTASVLKFDNNQLVFGASKDGNGTEESLRISFKDIIELTPNDKVVQFEDLSTVEFLFTAAINQLPDGSNVSKLIQTVELENGATFTVINSVYSTATVLTFGSSKVPVSAGGGKQTYIIKNWPFLSTSNTLQLHLNISTQGELIEDICTEESLSQLRSGITLNTDRGAIVINLLQLAALDNRFKHVSAELNSTDILLETPSFKDSMVYDPDFSVLLGGGSGGGGSGCNVQADQTLFYASLALIGFGFLVITIFISTVTIVDHYKKKAKLERKKKAESAFQQQQANFRS